MKKTWFPGPCCLQWAPQRDTLPPPSLPFTPKSLLLLAQRGLLRAVPVSSMSCRGHSAPVTEGGPRRPGTGQPLREPARGAWTREAPMLTTRRQKRVGFHCPPLLLPLLIPGGNRGAGGAGDPALSGSTAQPAAAPHSPPQGAVSQLSHTEHAAEERGRA